MDQRRRTLRPSGPSGNGVVSLSAPSGIPMAAVMKSSQASSSRLSMARQSGQVTAQGSAKPVSTYDGPRRSTMAHNPAYSGTRTDAGFYGRTSQQVRAPPGSVRRQSVFTSSSRPSLAPTSLSNPGIRDTRPYKDKLFASNCISNVTEYLLASRCPIPINSRTFTVISTKDIQAIFRFLVSDYVDSHSAWTRKFEDDAIQVLKDLRYPSMESCGKTALAQPGGSLAWPGVLAMLNWLVELNKAQDRWDDATIVADTLRMPIQQLPLDEPFIEDRLLWDFSSKTYQSWFEGGIDEFPDAEMALREIYDQLAQASFGKCEELETQIQTRQIELQQLQAQEPPLKTLEEEYVQLMSDKTKFIAFIDLHRQKAEKIKSSTERATSAIADQQKSLEAARAELQHIETAVAAQNLSPDEVQRMNSERENLAHSLDDLRVKLAQASQSSYDHELHLTRSMDRFEQLYGEYTALAHQIGIIDVNGQNSGTSDGLSYLLDHDLHSDMRHFQTEARRLKEELRPGLAAFGEQFRVAEVALANRWIELEDMHDRLTQDVEKRRQSVEHLESLVKGANEAAEGAKQNLSTETSTSNTMIAKLEGEVAEMSRDSQQGVSHAEHELETARIRYNELRHRTGLLQESVQTQLTKHIDIVVKAKDHTANALKSLRAFAESQIT